MPRNFFFLLPVILLGSCLKQPDRVVQYNVNCVHCIVKHRLPDGSIVQDTVKNGFLLRFHAEVKEELLLDATSLVTDQGMVARILVDTEEEERAYASGIPQRAVIETEVPKREN